jgi:hypothetical protein
MKKTLALAILGLTACATTYGQGVVAFNNYVSTTYQPVKYANQAGLGAQSGQPVTSATVELQLFWALGTFADQTSFDAAKNAGVTTFINPGVTFGGGGYYTGPNQTLAGWTAGQSVTFQVQGWETSGANGGATYAASKLEGTSALWQEVAAASANANGIQPASNPAKGFNVGPPAMTLALAVPEPSIFALSGLGAAALMLFRRKK